MDMKQDVSSVAVLLASYNGERYIREQLESLLKQTYPHVSIYVHDDGSTDGTVSIVEELEGTSGGKIRLLAYENPYKGSCGNFFSLIQYAKEHLNEQYFMFSDQDDVWLPDKIEKELRKLIQMEEGGTGASLVYCNQQIVDAALEPLENAEEPFVTTHRGKIKWEELVFRNVAPGCTIIFNRLLLDLISRAPSPAVIPMHDWWAMLTAFCYGQVGYIDDKLMLYRQHEANQIGSGSIGWRGKLMKYLGSMRKSLHKKKQQVKDCEAQVQLLAAFPEAGIYKQQLLELSRMLKKGRLTRIGYLWKKGYITFSHWLTTFFA